MMDEGSEIRDQGSGFRVQGSGCRVQGAGCRVQGFTCGCAQRAPRGSLSSRPPAGVPRTVSKTPVKTVVNQLRQSHIS